MLKYVIGVAYMEIGKRLASASTQEHIYNAWSTCFSITG